MSEGSQSRQKSQSPACPAIPTLRRVVSGGQTGVDQAALQAALDCGLEVGGWSPPNRMAENGPIPERFPLLATPTDRSPLAPDVPRSLRTAWNVRDADATLVVRLRPPPDAEPPLLQDPGTAFAARAALHFGRAMLVAELDAADEDGGADVAERIVRWCNALRVEALGVGGPSESTAPGVGDATYQLLVRTFRSDRS